MSKHTLVEFVDQVRGIKASQHCLVLVNSNFQAKDLRLASENFDLMPVDDRQSSTFWLIYFSFLGAMTAATLGGYLALIYIPPLADCENALTVTTDSEHLYCAQIKAATKKVDHIITAINMVRGWNENYPLYNASQKLLRRWSEDLINIARLQVRSGHYTQSINLLKLIPDRFAVYGKTHALITRWSQEKALMTTLESAFDRSLAKGDWKETYFHIKAVEYLLQSSGKSRLKERMSRRLAQRNIAIEY
jgi:hypothetical protein